MNDKSTQPRMIATTLFGLEEVLAKELVELGASEVTPLRRAVEFSGDKSVMYRANLLCRTAIRILKPIKTFRTSDEDELYKRIGSINWARFMEVDQTLAVDAVVSSSKMTDSRFIALKAKDAIVDQFRDRTGKRPSVSRDNPDISINLHLRKDLMTVSLNSSGEPLHRRGYRTDAGEAPINEVLAAGMVLASEWDGTSPFVDPMCGSGTIVIEAAMIAAKMAPGLKRKKFGFENFKDFAAGQYEKTRSEAAGLQKDSLPFEILGSDINKADLEIARANAERAGVDKLVRLETKDVSDQVPPSDPGVAILNPPYGERMKPEDINALYTMIGDNLKQKYEGYDAWILTSNVKAAKHIGLRASRKISLYNGALECRFLKYAMYRGSKKTKKQADIE